MLSLFVRRDRDSKTMRGRTFFFTFFASSLELYLRQSLVCPDFA